MDGKMVIAECVLYCLRHRRFLTTKKASIVWISPQEVSPIGNFYKLAANFNIFYPPSLLCWASPQGPHLQTEMPNSDFTDNCYAKRLPYIYYVLDKRTNQRTLLRFYSPLIPLPTVACLSSNVSFSSQGVNDHPPPQLVIWNAQWTQPTPTGTVWQYGMATKNCNIKQILGAIRTRWRSRAINIVH